MQHSLVLASLLLSIQLILVLSVSNGMGFDKNGTDKFREPINYFSDSYDQAREQFVKSATAAGARITKLPIAVRDVDGPALSIDIAWFGNKKPNKILLHTSGLHGVEGYAGSAIQIGLIHDLPAVPENSALVLVHCLNPYGMKFIRRYNESNVDLNRNFLFELNDYRGSPKSYESLNKFLNPPSPPANDLFYVRLAYHYLRLGSDNFLKSIATGQHDFPRGLFFGGHRLEKGPSEYRDWVQQSFINVERIFVIDVHTGLGDFGQESLFHKIAYTPAFHLNRTLHSPLLENFLDSDVVGYQFKGGHCELFKEMFADKRVDFLTQEFGTYSKLKILKALRDENRYHHYGTGDITHWSKQKLREAFYPRDESWRAGVLSNGIDLAHGVATILFDGKTAE